MKIIKFKINNNLIKLLILLMINNYKLVKYKIKKQIKINNNFLMN
jgi:hypothetical protein